MSKPADVDQILAVYGNLRSASNVEPEDPETASSLSGSLVSGSCSSATCPVKSGALVLFVFVGNIVIKPATTFLYGRVGFRRMLALSTAGMAVTMAAAASK